MALVEHLNNLPELMGSQGILVYLVAQCYATYCMSSHTPEKMAEAENKMKHAVDKHISLSVLTRPDSLLCDTEILICINVNCEAKIFQHIIDSCFLVL